VKRRITLLSKRKGHEYLYLILSFISLRFEILTHDVVCDGHKHVIVRALKFLEFIFHIVVVVRLANVT